MATPFLGEIKIVGFDFAPPGWAFCDGAILPINSFQALFSILGTTYGGDGRVNFALPDLRGRVPTHRGAGPGLPNLSLGERRGTESETLSLAKIAGHGHLQGTSDQATTDDPAGQAPASRPRRGVRVYRNGGTAISQAGDSQTGGGQSHTNMQPFLTLQFVIALEGLFPSRN